MNGEEQSSLSEGLESHLFSIKVFSFSSQALARDSLFSVSTRARAASETIAAWDYLLVNKKFKPIKGSVSGAHPLWLTSVLRL